MRLYYGATARARMSLDMRALSYAPRLRGVLDEQDIRSERVVALLRYLSLRHTMRAFYASRLQALYAWRERGYAYTRVIDARASCFNSSRAREMSCRERARVRYFTARR